MHLPIHLHQMQALATIKEEEPEQTREVLEDSGFGALAQDWLQASREFSRVARDADVEVEDASSAAIRAHVVRAYALRCVSWARISQLRDQARRSMEQPQ